MAWISIVLMRRYNTPPLKFSRARQWTAPCACTHHLVSSRCLHDRVGGRLQSRTCPDALVQCSRRDFMMTAFNLTEDQAITAITVGVDFSVSQVVNGNWGMQTIIPKVFIRPSPPSCYPAYAIPFLRLCSLRTCEGSGEGVRRDLHAHARASQHASTLHQ